MSIAKKIGIAVGAVAGVAFAALVVLCAIVAADDDFGEFYYD